MMQINKNTADTVQTIDTLQIRANQNKLVNSIEW